MEMKTKSGVVIAICTSKKHGYPTYPQNGVVTIGLPGIPGDAHFGELRESFRNPGTFKPNDRPISIVSEEVRQWINANLDLNMKHGDFNEQIVVQGLGDLGDIPIGTRIAFEGGVILEVVDYAYPCVKLEVHNGGEGKLMKSLIKKNPDGSIYSKRGILCKVIKPGELQAGYKVRL